MEISSPSRPPRKAHFLEALIPVVALVGFLAITLLGLNLEDPHIPLILGTAVAAVMGKLLGWSWQEMNAGMVHGISLGMSSILILLSIGILIGLWVASGIVPLLIHYGMLLLDPSYFLPATCLICAIVSITTGSSWTTAGTVGVALIGVAQGLNIPLEITAGAIVSGAYFGDKMSPLSDTTNLAPAVAGSELFEHIRHMAWTTGPSFLLALALFTFFSLQAEGTGGARENFLVLQKSLQSEYQLTPWLLLAPLLVVVLVIRKVPALPTLLVGAATGGLLGMVFQGQSMTEVVNAAMYGHVSTTEIELVDNLLSQGGMNSMFWTVGLILCALAFGGLMEKIGMLQVLAAGILRLARRTGSLVASTALTCLGMNIAAPDQYLSIVVPGRMFRTAYQQRKLHPKNLSRILEDSGTLTSPLIFWNTCGATMGDVLGISALLYWRWCFFNLINPVISLVYGFTGFTMEKDSRERTE